MKPMIGFLKNEKGIALLIVLWVMMLLWAIVGEFSYAVKLRLNIIKNFKDNTQSYYFAVAGLNNAIASLLEKEQGPVIPVVGNFIRDIESVIKEEGIEGSYSANIGNESGKVNINTSDDNLLLVMFDGIGIDTEQKNVIVDSILDWRDENNLHRMNGAEDDYYLSLENPYECRDNEFQSKEELLLVRGLSREIFAGIEGMITIYSTSTNDKSNIFAQRSRKSKSGKININFAPKELLSSLPTMTDDLADQIIEYRNDKTLQSINELQAIVGMDVYAAISRYLTISDSSFFSVDSFGFTESGHSKSVINAIIEINTKFENGYRFIQWKEGREIDKRDDQLSMNIGIDARPLSYHLTGIGYYLQNILDALQVIDQENNYYLVSNKTVNYQINNDKWSKIEGHAGGKPISSIWMQTCVPGLARKYKFDIFWGTRHHLPLFLSRRVKRVVTIHDLVHLRYPETMQPKNLILERILMKRSLSAADAIISVSHATATDIKKCYAKIQENHIHTIYSGVPQLYEAHDCSRIIVQLPQKYFLFVGTLEPRKNIHNILRAFERLNPEKYDIYLVIVGEKGWKDKELKKYLVDYNFESRIVFTGYVSRDMMINLYKKSVCLIFPSLYEGFGFPILEAMSCGTPVITSNTSTMKEIAADAALLVNPYDDAEIARAMRLILIDTDLRKRLIGKAALRLKHFSWERCAHKLMEIFYKVTNN